MMTTQWFQWPHDQCPVCGSAVEIETSAPQEFDDSIEIDGDPVPPPYCYCGDVWRCEDGHTGHTYAEANEPVSLEGEGA